ISAQVALSHSTWPFDQMKCGRCCKFYKTCPQLKDYLSDYHEQGRFECGHQGCRFTADLRGAVYNHQLILHVPKIHACKFSGCDKSFRADSLLASHERVHLGTKPFKCTWPECG